jgi:hypothetical protein
MPPAPFHQLFLFVAGRYGMGQQAGSWLRSELGISKLVDQPEEARPRQCSTIRPGGGWKIVGGLAARRNHFC